MFIIHGRHYAPGRSKSTNTFKQCANSTEVEQYLRSQRRKLDPDIAERFFRVWEVEESAAQKFTYRYPMPENA